MASGIHWYDFICFAIVGAAIIFSLWLLWRREHCKKWTNSKYESLLISQSEGPDGYIDSTRTSHVSSSQLWTTCWKDLNPLGLLATRFLSLLVMAGLLTYDIRLHGTIMFIYYTEWTCSLVIVYFTIATFVSAHGCWKNSKKLENEQRDNLHNDEIDAFTETSMQESKSANFKAIKVTRSIKEQNYNEGTGQRAGFWGYMMQTIYQTCAGAVFLTDIVFWCIIVPFLTIAHVELNLLMGCMHTLNAVFLLLDTALNNLPFPWFRLAYFILWSCLYVIFQWLLHACGFSWWPYPFLDLSTPWAPVWYFCLALIHIPCYGLYALIVKFKNTILPRWFPHAYVRSY